jgi:hypothetical protein
MAEIQYIQVNMNMQVRLLIIDTVNVVHKAMEYKKVVSQLLEE